jgi:hypothetical protein
MLALKTIPIGMVFILGEMRNGVKRRKSGAVSTQSGNAFDV